MKKEIVLASASPRRKELMKLITDKYVVRAANVDETVPLCIPLDKSAEYVAKIKAEAVRRSADEVIIGCDTMVITPMGEILGKPRDRDDCRRMLHTLSGMTHNVCTGVCIIFGSEVRTFTETTEVVFDALTDEDIQRYIDTDEPFDKAGGYGIQGKGALLVTGIIGDFFNVVGLPVNHLYSELRHMGVL